MFFEVALLPGSSLSLSVWVSDRVVSSGTDGDRNDKHTEFNKVPATRMEQHEPTAEDSEMHEQSTAHSN